MRKTQILLFSVLALSILLVACENLVVKPGEAVRKPAITPVVEESADKCLSGGNRCQTDDQCCSASCVAHFCEYGELSPRPQQPVTESVACCPVGTTCQGGGNVNNKGANKYAQEHVKLLCLHHRNAILFL